MSRDNDGVVSIRATTSSYPSDIERSMKGKLLCALVSGQRRVSLCLYGVSRRVIVILIVMIVLHRRKCHLLQCLAEEHIKQCDSPHNQQARQADSNEEGVWGLYQRSYGLALLLLLDCRMLFSADAVSVAQVLRPVLATARELSASTLIVASSCFAEPVLRLQGIKLSANVAGVIFVEKR